MGSLLLLRLLTLPELLLLLLLLLCCYCSISQKYLLRSVAVAG
jgi:hypothetical protein